MTTDTTKRQTSFAPAPFGRNWFRVGLLMLGLPVCVVIVFLWAQQWVFAPPALQPEDLLLLAPESIVRVEAAAKAGNILAQSSVGTAHRDGSR